MNAITTGKLAPKFQARACTVNKEKSHIAIAFNDGKIVIKSLSDLKSNLYVLNNPNEWCECLE
jgi:hypothetical protein